MAVYEAQKNVSLETIWNTIQGAKRKNEWEKIVALKGQMPQSLTSEWLPVADEVAFALGQVGRYDEAVALWEKVYDLEPTHRTASALAYVFYLALLQAKVDKDLRKSRDRRSDIDSFLGWIKKALDHWPDSVKDHYRLAVFYAQILSARDKDALREYRRAIDAFEKLSVRTRDRFRKTYVLALYGAARSAFRLHNYGLAGRLVTQCIAEDKDTGYMADQFKYGLAGKIALALGQYAEADRCLRTALDQAKRNHWYLYSELAKVALAQGKVTEASRWIEAHVPVHKRSSVMWRLLGDIRTQEHRLEDAEVAYRNALRRDRAGRHLTLLRLGHVLVAQGRLKEARKAFKDARRFKKKTYVSDFPAALEGLIQVAEQLGDEDAAASYRHQLQEIQEEREEGRFRGAHGTSWTQARQAGEQKSPMSQGEPAGSARSPVVRTSHESAPSGPSVKSQAKVGYGALDPELLHQVKVKGQILLPDGLTYAPRWKVRGRDPFNVHRELQGLPKIWEFLESAETLACVFQAGPL